jgi:hypothetical protein
MRGQGACVSNVGECCRLAKIGHDGKELRLQITGCYATCKKWPKTMHAFETRGRAVLRKHMHLRTHRWLARDDRFDSK